MGIGDSLPTYYDFKPFLDFLSGTAITLIIVLFTPRFFANEQKINYQFKTSICISAFIHILYGFASALLIKVFILAIIVIYGLITWVPIYIFFHLTISNPDSYLPIVIADVSTIVFSFILGIIAILIKPKITYKVYSYSGFAVGFLFGTALLYSFNILFLLLIFIGIIGALIIDRVRQSTNFKNSDLTYANFTSANLEATDFTGAKLTNTDFKNAKF